MTAARKLWLRRLAALVLGPLAALTALAAPPHLGLDVRLDPATRELRAVAELASPGELHFALHRTLAVTAALADGTRTTVEPGADAGDRRIWRLRARPGARVRIEYGGTLPALDRSLDHRGVLGRLAPMASNRGSFLASGSGWYPAPGSLFTYRVRLSLPAGQRGLVAGRLVAESPPEAKRYDATFEFEHAADGIDLMAGPYSIRERIVPRAGTAPLRLRTYFYPDLDPLASGYLDDAQRYLELYRGRIGEYPYSEFSVIASPLPTGYGMPTLTYIGAEVLRLPFIRASSLGHEVLHNWWGNGVYADYAKGNWTEGLTTFMADYAYKESESPDAARAMRLGWLRDFAAVPPGAHQSLAEFRSRTHGAAAAVGYGKSAMLFFMLRDLIGEQAFERGIRRFWETNRFSIASWDDLRAAFESESGRSLSAFFAQWLERKGGPRVRIIDARAAGSKLVLTLEQSKPAYALRMPIEVASGSHAETRSIEIEHERETVTIAVEGSPDTVRLDPELRVWRLLEREELPPILRQWIIARAPRLAIVSGEAEVVSAARALAAAFFEARARETLAADALRGGEPILVVGLAADVDRALERLGLPGRPAALAGRGSAQVWTVARGLQDAPVAVISARDAAALNALARPLPHYGAQSFLVFDGAKVLERGVWPGEARSVPVAR